jgi:hypothetical protein
MKNQEPKEEPYFSREIVALGRRNYALWKQKSILSVGKEISPEQLEKLERFERQKKP